MDLTTNNFLQRILSWGRCHLQFAKTLGFENHLIQRKILNEKNTPPGKWWNVISKGTISKGNYIFQPSILRGYVSFRRIFFKKMAWSFRAPLSKHVIPCYFKCASGLYHPSCENCLSIPVKPMKIPLLLPAMHIFPFVFTNEWKFVTEKSDKSEEGFFHHVFVIKYHKLGPLDQAFCRVWINIGLHRKCKQHMQLFGDFKLILAIFHNWHKPIDKLTQARIIVTHWFAPHWKVQTHTTTSSSLLLPAEHLEMHQHVFLHIFVWCYFAIFTLCDVKVEITVYEVFFEQIKEVSPWWPTFSMRPEMKQNPWTT